MSGPDDIAETTEAALLRYARAKARCDSYRGAFRGDLFEQRTKGWRSALIALDRAALAFRLARIDAYLATRQARRQGVADASSSS